MTVTATSRYGAGEAPGGLLLVQDLANTIPHPRPPVGSDLLSDAATATDWLAEAGGRWCAVHGLARPVPTVTDDDLSAARLLRHRIRRLLGAEGPQERTGPAMAADVRIEVTPGHATVEPLGTGVGWLASAVAAECLLSRCLGVWTRLKICRNTACGVVFYDRSRNSSGVWHDVSVCGNAANVRAFRARRTAGKPR
ncbi:CGNR zinc finger domain-containing protein [Streptomyces nodosus]|uniref:CGNR zinc finger domain-containing protein n=1 Tax=Streptomyces nodosus TaxID=40318 RepID=A0A0B5DFG3_9ACTN|nr:CGNR zinc finger domain-containing protein [Streptomyces nodosus]AJE39161.1 hypothetical protein SNOD_03275 [Streptomyces nodosus]MBB4790045.1 putative RNA-binding Zn ribbon-like protein [Streptomyces nodosus]QEV37761.1 CGNR zinc finger domain-containing protein [Streptomyces nodosus]